MQIKTCLLLGAGIFVGYWLFGDAEEHEKAITAVKRVLYKWQTGKDLPKSPPYRPANYVSYNSAYNKDKIEYRKKWQTEKKNPEEFTFRMPMFDTEKEAEECLHDMIKIAQKFKTVSVLDLMTITGKECPWTWDNWGWDEDDVIHATVKECAVSDSETKWTITNLRPVRNLATYL